MTSDFEALMRRISRLRIWADSGSSRNVTFMLVPYRVKQARLCVNIDAVSAPLFAVTVTFTVSVVLVAAS